MSLLSSWLPLSILGLSTLAWAQAVPQIDQPLTPDAAAPGSASLTLQVRGTGFASSSVVKFDGLALATTFLNAGELNATVPASLLKKAHTAQVTVLTKPSKRSNVALFSVANSKTIIAVTRSQISTLADGILSSDLNGDGKTDLVVCQSSATEIYLGNGNGTFTQGTTIPEGSSFFNSTLADVNQDGKLDLILQPGKSSVDVLLGNGDGTFQSAVSYSSGTGNGFSLAVADLNGDGNPDIILTDLTGATLLEGTGHGTFGPPQQTIIIPRQGVIPFAIRTGDFNGDGLTDVAIVDQNQIYNGLLEVYLGNGDGSFEAFPTFVATDRLVQDLVIADFNGDGKADLASVGIDLYLSLGNGDGTFQNPLIQSNLACDYLTAGDLNADGKLDLACGASQLLALLGNGDGTFQNSIPLIKSSFAVPMAIGDFNRDGRLDFAGGIASTSGKTALSILLQKP
jgi:hypothetical protein